MEDSTVLLEQVTKDNSPVIMAGDTREPDPTSSDATISPKKPKHEFPKTQVGKLWEAFGNPEEPVNVLPGSTYSPNREKTKDISLAESMKTLSMKDFTTFHKKPCARDSLLVGIGAGFGLGGVRGLVGGLAAIWPACNWAVGAFTVTSIIAYEFCQRRRVNEIEGMKQAVELMQELKMKKKREDEQLKISQEAARRVAEEDERRRKSWINFSRFKFW